MMFKKKCKHCERLDRELRENRDSLNRCIDMQSKLHRKELAILAQENQALRIIIDSREKSEVSAVEKYTRRSEFNLTLDDVLFTLREMEKCLRTGLSREQIYEEYKKLHGEEKAKIWKDIDHDAIVYAIEMLEGKKDG